MARTALATKNLKPKAKLYRGADSGGLCLEGAPSGCKLWRRRHYFNGKPQMLALGNEHTTQSCFAYLYFLHFVHQHRKHSVNQPFVAAFAYVRSLKTAGYVQTVSH
jgi:hypothetical protein